MIRRTLFVGGVSVGVLALCAGTASATDVQVRDAAGGENSQGDPGGLYIAPTGSRLHARTDNNALLRDIASGAFGFEKGPAGGGGPWEMFMTYCFEPEQSIEFAAHPNNFTGVTYKQAALSRTALLF